MSRLILFLFALCSITTVWGDVVHEKIEQVIQSSIVDNRYSGTVFVMKGSEVLHKKAYGTANEAGPNTLKTKFGIGSLSKQFTATAILLLNEEGKLSVHDKVSSIVSVPDHWAGITIHQLLTHTAGVLRDAPFTNEEYDQFHNSEVLYKKIVEAPLPEGFSPGLKYSYSNAGYAVLAYIVEQVSGQSFEEFMTEKFFIPLEMLNTGINQKENSHLADGHYVKKETNEIIPIPYDKNYLSHFLGSGSFYSTSDDLMIWMQALKAKKMLKPSSWELMFEKYALISTDESNSVYYGYGWSLEDYLKNKDIFHSGSLAGFYSMVDYLVESDVISIILCNVQTRPFYLGKVSAGILKVAVQAP